MEHRQKKGKRVGFLFSFPLLEYWLGTSEEKMVAKLENFSFSNDQTSSLPQQNFLMSQCPLEYRLEETLTSTNFPTLVFLTMGRGGGKKGTGKILNNLSSFEELPPAKGEEGFEK